MLPTHHIHVNRSEKMDDPFQAHLAQTPTDTPTDTHVRNLPQ